VEFRRKRGRHPAVVWPCSSNGTIVSDEPKDQDHGPLARVVQILVLYLGWLVERGAPVDAVTVLIISKKV